MFSFKTPNRYYLNGIDWSMAALNALNIKKSGTGNHSQLILVLKGYLEKDLILKKITVSLSNGIFLRGRAKRAWHLAPYWCVEKKDFPPGDFSFYKIASTDTTELNTLIHDIAKAPFKDDKTLIQFYLIHFNNLSYLIMKFDHKMFDARGAEALLEHILGEKTQKEQYDLPVQGPQLNLWKSRFLSGRVINRFLRSVYLTCKVATLKKKNNQNPFETDSYNFLYTTLSERKTDIIDKNTMDTAGYLMQGIYILSIVTKAFDLLLKKHKKPGNILVSINVDVRETKFESSKIFFNNVSFMLFNLKQDRKISEYIIDLRKQFILQVKKEIPRHFINASLLMRILPVKVLALFMELRMKKNPITFSFSHISEQAFFLKNIKGHEVVNLFHIPLVPVSPGVGVFFTRFNNKLNMIISSSDNRIDLKDAEFLEKTIVSGLIGGKI